MNKKIFTYACIIITTIALPYHSAKASEKQQEACKEKYLPKAETDIAAKVYAGACMRYYEDKLTHPL